MPEIIPDHVPSPRTALFWDGTAYRPGTIDAAGHIQIDVLSTAMDALAANAANQALILGQLQLIEDMRDALQSVATDRLIVRGENQLFSFRENLLSPITTIISGAGGWIQSVVPGPASIWVVTTVVTYDNTSPTTAHRIMLRAGGVNHEFHYNEQAFATADRTVWSGHVYLDPTTRVRVEYAGALVGDSCVLHLTGYIMTLEV